MEYRVGQQSDVDGTQRRSDGGAQRLLEYRVGLQCGQRGLQCLGNRGAGQHGGGDLIQGTGEHSTDSGFAQEGGDGHADGVGEAGADRRVTQQADHGLPHRCPDGLGGGPAAQREGHYSADRLCGGNLQFRCGLQRVRGATQRRCHERGDLVAQRRQHRRVGGQLSDQGRDGIGQHDDHGRVAQHRGVEGVQRGGDGGTQSCQDRRVRLQCRQRLLQRGGHVGAGQDRGGDLIDGAGDDVADTGLDQEGVDRRADHRGQAVGESGTGQQTLDGAGQCGADLDGGGTTAQRRGHRLGQLVADQRPHRFVAGKGGDERGDGVGQHRRDRRIAQQFDVENVERSGNGDPHRRDDVRVRFQCGQRALQGDRQIGAGEHRQDETARGVAESPGDPGLVEEGGQDSADHVRKSVAEGRGGQQFDQRAGDGDTDVGGGRGVPEDSADERDNLLADEVLERRVGQRAGEQPGEGGAHRAHQAGVAEQQAHRARHGSVEGVLDSGLAEQTLQGARQQGGDIGAVQDGDGKLTGEARQGLRHSGRAEQTVHRPTRHSRHTAAERLISQQFGDGAAQQCGHRRSGVVAGQRGLHECGDRLTRHARHLRDGGQRGDQSGDGGAQRPGEAAVGQQPAENFGDGSADTTGKRAVAQQVLLNRLQHCERFHTVEHIGGQQSGGTGQGTGHARLAEKVGKHRAECGGQRHDEGLVGEQSGHRRSDSLGDAGGRGVPRECGRHVGPDLRGGPFAHRLLAGQTRDQPGECVTEAVEDTGVGEQRIHDVSHCRDDTVAEVVVAQQSWQSGFQRGQRIRTTKQSDDDVVGQLTECGRDSGLAEEVRQHRPHDGGQSAGEGIVRQQSGHHVADHARHGVAERPAAQLVGHQACDLIAGQGPHCLQPRHAGDQFGHSGSHRSDHACIGQQPAHQIRHGGTDAVLEGGFGKQRVDRLLDLCGRVRAELGSGDRTGGGDQVGGHSGLAQEVAQQRTDRSRQSPGEGGVRHQSGHHVTHDVGDALTERGVAELPDDQVAGLLPGDGLDALVAGQPDDQGFEEVAHLPRERGVGQQLGDRGARGDAGGIGQRALDRQRGRAQEAEDGVDRHGGRDSADPGLAQEGLDRGVGDSSESSAGVGKQGGDGTRDDRADRCRVGTARTDQGVGDQLAEVPGHRRIGRGRTGPVGGELTGEHVQRAGRSGSELFLHGGGAQERAQFVANRDADHADQRLLEIEPGDDQVVEEVGEPDEARRQGHRAEHRDQRVADRGVTERELDEVGHRVADRGAHVGGQPGQGGDLGDPV